MSDVFTIIAVAAALVTLLMTCVTAYYNRQTARSMAGLPPQPKPWHVRLFDRIFR